MVRGHMQDTGGSFPGGYFPNAYDIIAEGLCIPPLKVIKAGVEDADVMALICNNVRCPDEMKIDSKAMIATTRVRREPHPRPDPALRQGHGDRRRARDDGPHREARCARRSPPCPTAPTAASPRPTTTAPCSIEPVTVRVDVTIKGDEMTLDFSRSDAQRTGFVNCVYAVTYARAVAAAIVYMDPALADFHNTGSMRPIKVIAPLGSVTNARYPATVGASPVNVGCQVVEATVEALSKAKPDRSIAGWGRHRGDYTFATDPRTGERYVRTTFDYDGSAGAVWGHDGMMGPTTLTTLGSVQRGSVEEAEIRFPWRMLKLEARTDFNGAGRWRGGGGIDWRALNEGSDGRMATGSLGRRRDPRQGRAGRAAQSRARAPSSCAATRRSGSSRTAWPRSRRGDIVVKLSAGGAGVGDPWERPIEKVADRRAQRDGHRRGGAADLRRRRRSEDAAGGRGGDEASCASGAADAALRSGDQRGQTLDDRARSRWAEQKEQPP